VGGDCSHFNCINRWQPGCKEIGERGRGGGGRREKLQILVMNLNRSIRQFASGATWHDVVRCSNRQYNFSHEKEGGKGRGKKVGVIILGRTNKEGKEGKKKGGRKKRATF